MGKSTASTRRGRLVRVQAGVRNSTWRGGRIGRAAGLSNRTPCGFETRPRFHSGVVQRQDRWLLTTQSGFETLHRSHARAARRYERRSYTSTERVRLPPRVPRGTCPCSSTGRAPALQAGCRGFNSLRGYAQHDGGCSAAVGAPGCGPGTRRFDPGQSPHGGAPTLESRARL
jgi:hypothetical protein